MSFRRLKKLQHEFLDQCSEFGVKLTSGEIKEALATENTPNRCVPTGIWSYSSVLRSVALAAQIRRSEPSLELANNPLPVHQIDPLPEKLLARIINSSLGVAPDLTTPYVYDSAYELPEPDACAHAEYLFSQTGKWLTEEQPQEDGGNLERDTKLFVDRRENVIFMEKPFGERSSLALEPIIVDGYTCPPGSLVAVNETFASRVERAETRPDDKSDSPTTVVIPEEEISGVEFIRLSLFALPPGIREQYFRAQASQFGDIVYSRNWPGTLEEITNTAQSALNYV